MASENIHARGTAKAEASLGADMAVGETRVTIETKEVDLTIDVAVRRSSRRRGAARRERPYCHLPLLCSVVSCSPCACLVDLHCGEGGAGAAFEGGSGCRRRAVLWPRSAAV